MRQSPRAETPWGAFTDYEWPNGGWSRVIVVNANDGCAGLLINEAVRPDGPIEVFNHVTDLAIGIASALDEPTLIRRLSTETDGTNYVPQPGSLRAMLKIRQITTDLEYLIEEAQASRGKARCVGWASHPKGRRGLQLLTPMGFQTEGNATVRHVRRLTNITRATRQHEPHVPWHPLGPNSRAVVGRKQSNGRSD